MRKDTGLYNIEDIQELLDCGKTKAYDLIRELNRERKQQKLIVVPGRVPAEYFNKRYFED